MSSPQFLFWELGPLHVFKANRLRKMKFGVWVDVYKWCAGRHVQVHASRFKKNLRCRRPRITSDAIL